MKCFITKLGKFHSVQSAQSRLLCDPVFLVPFVKEAQGSCQAYEQQAHAENSGDYLLLRQRLSDELQVTTAGAVEARLTLAVVLIDVHQQHALPVIQAVMLIRAVAV